MSSPLPIRHELFAREMAAGQSAAAAARAAGYAPSNARNQGMTLMNTASIRDRIEALQAAAEAARAARVARMAARLDLIYLRAMAKENLNAAMQALRDQARITGLLPCRAMPLDIAPELVDATEQYERFQARFATPTKPDTSHATAPPSSPADAGERLERGPGHGAQKQNAPSQPSPGQVGGGRNEPATAATPTKPDTSHATAPPPAPADAGEGLGRRPGHGAEKQNAPSQPSPGQAGGGRKHMEEEHVAEPTTPDEWRAVHKNIIPWWVPQELSGEAAWDHVAAYMAAPIVLREGPAGGDPFAAPEEADDEDGTPTDPDISTQASSARWAA